MINRLIFYRPPMWMLVNSTIFNGIDETQVMVDALIDLMKGLKVQFCGVEEGDSPRVIDEEGPNCQWEEYQQTKEYLEKVQSTLNELVYILHCRLMTSFKIACSNPQTMVQSSTLSWDLLIFSQSLMQESRSSSKMS